MVSEDHEGGPWRIHADTPGCTRATRGKIHTSLAHRIATLAWDATLQPHLLPVTLNLSVLVLLILGTGQGSCCNVQTFDVHSFECQALHSPSLMPSLRICTDNSRALSAYDLGMPPAVMTRASAETLLRFCASSSCSPARSR